MKDAMNKYGKNGSTTHSLHNIAKGLLDDGKVEEAWKLLLSVNY
jgi:hypothetical protein